MITPILVSQFLWSLGQNVESAVYGHLGTQNLAAYTLTCPIQSLIVGRSADFPRQAGVLIGKRLGRKEYDAAYGDAKKIMTTGLAGRGGGFITAGRAGRAVRGAVPRGRRSPHPGPHAAGGVCDVCAH